MNNEHFFCRLSKKVSLTKKKLYTHQLQVKKQLQNPSFILDSLTSIKYLMIEEMMFWFLDSNFDHIAALIHLKWSNLFEELSFSSPVSSSFLMAVGLQFLEKNPNHHQLLDKSARLEFPASKDQNKDFCLTRVFLSSWTSWIV
jgi:hypothetical protein